MAGSSSSNGWAIKKVMTASDVTSGIHSIQLRNGDVKEHILSHWNENRIKRAAIDGVKMVVKDADTNSYHNVNLRHYRHDNSYVLEGEWRMNFVDRRYLSAGDEIGLHYDSTSGTLLFSVLKRA